MNQKYSEELRKGIVLCEALEVARGTFYNHIFRRKVTTQYDIRREEIREQIKAVFDESKQRFGAKKICAVLAARNIKTSPRYVSELMKEMDLQSVGQHSNFPVWKTTRQCSCRSIFLSPKERRTLSHKL